MESIIQTFHIEWSLLLAQVVNFTVVALVLWFFALKPLFQKMAERTSTIEKSLDEAKKISENLKKSHEERDAIIHSARRESQKIMEEARLMAEEEREKNLVQIKEQVQKIAADSKKQIIQEKEKMFVDLQQEASDLVVLATAKILGNVIDNTIDKKIVQDALKEARKEIIS